MEMFKKYAIIFLGAVVSVAIAKRLPFIKDYL